MDRQMEVRLRGLRRVLETATETEDPRWGVLLRWLAKLEDPVMDDERRYRELANLQHQMFLWAINNYSSGARAARERGRTAASAPRESVEDRRTRVLDSHRRMRRHVSDRDDARRIAEETGIPFETVRGYIKRAKKIAGE